MITHQQDKYRWNFNFLGINIDAVSEAEKLGIYADFARNYKVSGTGSRDLYVGVSATMACMRTPEFDHKKKTDCMKR